MTKEEILIKIQKLEEIKAKVTKVCELASVHKRIQALKRELNSR